MSDAPGGGASYDEATHRVEPDPASAAWKATSRRPAAARPDLLPFDPAREQTHTVIGFETFPGIGVRPDGSVVATIVEALYVYDHTTGQQAVVRVLLPAEVARLLIRSLTYGLAVADTQRPQGSPDEWNA